MILTEEEAKTKRCQESFGPPLSPDGTAILAAAMYQSTTTSPSHCIGSACMAWRFSADETGDGIPRGYCGEAGLP
jgi:hypothetical protein